MPRANRARRAGPVGDRFAGDGLIVVGTVGRLSPVKHQRLLVDAFARACATAAPDVAARMRLLLVGDGPDRAALETQVAATGIAERVWMTGSRDDVPALMADLDLFVLPSLAEGISNTILEAMACGLPVIATRVGGNAELVDAGRVGTLVPSDDVAAMAEALVAYTGDASRLAREGAAARRHVVERFSIDAMVEHYTALYDGLLERRHPTRRALAATGASPGSADRGRRRHDPLDTRLSTNIHG